MSFKITSVGRYCPPAVGAVRFLTLYIPEETTNLPLRGCAVYSGPGPESSTAVSIQFDRWSARHQSRGHTDARPGDWWLHTVEFTMRRQRPALARWMFRMKNRRFHLLLEDWYGERLFFDHMRVRTGRELGKTFGGKNGLDFHLVKRSRHPGTMLPPAPPPPPPSGIWSGSDNDQWGDPDNNEVWGW